MNITITYPSSLPIVARREEIIEAVAGHQVVIIAGETGSGKTTQIPKMCLEAGRGRKGLIGCTQPRRLAAISVAERVAEELGPENRRLVGHRIRFQDRTSRSTRIKFMTDGILLAEAQHDRALRAYDTVIIDEAHERSLNIDFLLGMLKRLIRKRRDLKLIITSATIDTEKFSSSFGQAPVIEVSGRAYPVEVRYQSLESEPDGVGDLPYVDQAVKAVRDICRDEHHGDILVFMPTERDIRETVETLAKTLGRQPGRAGAGAVVLPLFGRLSPADQKRIFRPVPGRKIVVATNVAETSITVPGIRYVVDTGLARIAGYNPRARTHKLPVVPVSRASCDQRLGRCGRVGPGVCVRLYSEENYLNRPQYTPPEILRANLAEVILRMVALRLGDPAEFPFIDPPSGRAIRDGFALLTELGALDRHRRFTARGKVMARLPLDPAIARMIIEARDNNCLREVSVIAAALSVQDPRVRPADREQEADAAHAPFVDQSSDFLTLLNIWDTYTATAGKVRSKSRLRKFCRGHYLSWQRMREWGDIHEQVREILDREGGFTVNTLPAGRDAVHQAILAGNLRNIGLRKMKNIYQGAGGKEMMVFPGSARFNQGGDWIMAAELVETSNLYARTVAAIKPEWLEPLAGELCRSSYSDPHWEKKRGQVVAFEKVTLFGLVIVARRRVNFGRIDRSEARRIFIQEALVPGEIKGGYGFIRHNQALIGSLREMEDRVRRRDVLVDEESLGAFYDRRLARQVWDQAGLNRMLRKEGGDQRLRMTEADILNAAPDRDRLEQFPREIVVDGIPLRLTYSFAPGSGEDGVSVMLPVELATHFRPEDFEWLVPGLLPDKITFLLKGLPKAVRKGLIPVPRTAGFLLGVLPSYGGSFYEALGQAVADHYGVRVQKRQWPADALPQHLRFRYCLVDGRGKIVSAGRNLADLARAIPLTPVNEKLVGLRKQWEQDTVDLAELGELPARIPIGEGKDVRGFAYPALAEAGRGKVALRLLTDERESRKQTRKGLLTLFRNHFSAQLKRFAKEFAVARAHWALYEGLGGHEQFNHDLEIFLLEEIFSCRDGRIPDRREYGRRLEAIRRRGIHAPAREAYDLVLDLLRERRQTLDIISRYESLAGKAAGVQERFAGYRRQVRELVPERFLLESTRPDIEALPRYLKALRIRVERAHAAPARDAAKEAQVAPHEARLRSCLREEGFSPERQRMLAEYRRMIEEFKISLFAQELKTAFPVSGKRLEQKWRRLQAIS